MEPSLVFPNHSPQTCGQHLRLGIYQSHYPSAAMLLSITVLLVFLIINSSYTRLVAVLVLYYAARFHVWAVSLGPLSVVWFVLFFQY